MTGMRDLDDVERENELLARHDVVCPTCVTAEAAAPPETVDHGRTVNVAWHDTVLIDHVIHSAKMLADADDGGGIAVTSDDGELIASLPLPTRQQARLNLARLIAADGWTIVPSESATNAAAMQEDLARILDALGLPVIARPYSPHECVTRDVLPAIDDWRRRLRDAEVQAAHDDPEPVDPASVKVGDVVEIEADDGTWMVRAPVTDVDDPEHDGPRYPADSPIGLRINDLCWWPILSNATVRVLHPAEPEPDEAAVEALREVYYAAEYAVLGPDGEIESGKLIRELAKRGVRVVSTDE